MSRKTRTRRDQVTQHSTLRRFAMATAIGVVCQLVFLFAHQAVLAEHYVRRAQKAVASGKSQDAAVWARRSLELNPHEGYAAFFAGLAAQEQGHVAQAIEWFQRALRTMAHRSQPLRELAACEEKQGDRAAAARHLVEALAIEPTPSGGPVAQRAQLGRHLFGLGRWADGIVQFRMAIADARASRVGFDGLAVGYQYLGALDSAVAAAFALLGSPQYAPKASAHLSRLATSAVQKPLIVAGLKEMHSVLQAEDPRRAVMENLLKSIVAGQ